MFVQLCFTDMSVLRNAWLCEVKPTPNFHSHAISLLSSLASYLTSLFHIFSSKLISHLQFHFLQKTLSRTEHSLATHCTLSSSSMVVSKPFVMVFMLYWVSFLSFGCLLIFMLCCVQWETGIIFCGSVHFDLCCCIVNKQEDSCLEYRVSVLFWW